MMLKIAKAETEEDAALYGKGWLKYESLLILKNLRRDDDEYYYSQFKNDEWNDW